MMCGSGRSPATALLLNVPIKVRLNHFVFYIRQRVKNNNPNVKIFLFDSGRPRRHDQLIFTFRKDTRIEPVGIHDADAACRPLP